MTRAYVALGSNLGDRGRLIDEATARLGRAGTVAARSQVLETEPVGPVHEQPRFLNCVVALDTELGPRELLAACLEIERELGRVRAEPGGPRTIDLDILLYDDVTVREADLTIPHPALGERDFWTAGLRELGGADVLSAVLVALVTGLATGLGSLPFFFVDRLPRKVYDSLLGVGAGLMLTAATLGLLPAALAHVREGGSVHAGTLALVVVGLGLGFLIMFVMDKNIPHWHAAGHGEHQHDEGGEAHEAGHAHAGDTEHQHMDDPSPKAHRQGLLITGAMTIHRLPEGFALGASFAVGTGHHQLGIMLAVAIAMQNACEGVVMAAPLRHGGMKRMTTLGLTAATGLSTPIGALAGYAFSHALTAALPIALAIAAGSLITLTSHEIIPETHSHGHEIPATLGIVAGVAAMVVIITLLGEA